MLTVLTNVPNKNIYNDYSKSYKRIHYTAVIYFFTTEMLGVNRTAKENALLTLG